MTTAARADQMLDEIDARQDEVIRQLDELDRQIERVLAEYAPARMREPSAERA